MIGGPALQRQRLKEYLPADLCHHGRTAAVEVLWVVWRPLNEPWGLRFVWVSEIEHLGIPFFMPFFLDLEFFHLFWEEDAWMRACARCPKRMTKSWRICAEELCVYEYLWVYILSSSLFQESEESHSVSPEINGQPVGKIPSSGQIVCWTREMFNEVSALSICRK